MQTVKYPLVFEPLSISSEPKPDEPLPNNFPVKPAFFTESLLSGQASVQSYTFRNYLLSSISFDPTRARNRTESATLVPQTLSPRRIVTNA